LIGDKKLVLSLGGGFMNKARIERILNKKYTDENGKSFMKKGKEESNQSSITNIIMPPMILKKTVSLIKIDKGFERTMPMFKEMPTISRNGGSPKKTIFLSVRMPCAEPYVFPTFKHEPEDEPEPGPVIPRLTPH
jgi:hypothetical protein